jgi:alpha-L-fucosidase
VSASANHATSGHAASGLVDHSYLNYWESGTTSATITLDQGSSKPIAYLAVNQREWTVSKSPSSSARIKDYQILSSTNGTTWTTVKTATLLNARGARFIDIGVTARYLRLQVNSIYGGTSLAIDELWLGSAYV